MSVLQKFLILLPLLLCAACADAQEQDQSSQDYEIRLETVASGLEYPWGLTFLPNGDMLVTEREGQLRIIRDGQLDPEPISGLPKNIYVAGQGGLLDVVLHPDFETNQFVYISYAGEGDGGAGTEVARGKLVDHALQEVEVIFQVTPKTPGTNHYGSRLLFLPDQTLLITVGDRYSYMDQAQNLDNHLGTILRVNDDGSIPQDNPFVGQEGARPEIYTYGHRNTQGIDLRPSDQSVWMHEHGPRGGDEVNIIKPGLNYGWPEITYGIDYSGAIISEKTKAPGMEQPVIYWDPSIAPSGMTFYDGNIFPEWQGDIFLGALAGQHLRRLELDGNKVIEQELLLDGYGRVRDVINGPEGYLYILIDDLNGKVIKLMPQ